MAARNPGNPIATMAPAAVYRTQDVRILCSVCKDTAHTRCPCCQRTFCLEHSATTTLCRDCEMVYELKVSTVKGYARCASFVFVDIIVALAYYFGPAPLWQSLGASLMLLVLLGVPLVLLSGPAAAAAYRRYFLGRHASASPVIEGARIEVAPRSADERLPRRRGGPAAYRNRGDAPQLPSWQRTYGVG